MSLPLSRNTTYSASDPVKSADLNDIQDQIIGGKHGDIIRPIPFTWFGNASVGGNPDFQFSYSAGDANVYALGAARRLIARLPVYVGDTLISAVLKCVDNTGGDVQLLLWDQDLTAAATPGTPSQIGGTQTSAGPSANIQDLSVTGLTEPIVADHKYTMEIFFNGASPSLVFYDAFCTVRRT